MKDTVKSLSYEIQLQPGEKLSLPPSLVERVGAGRWLITVQPVVEDRPPIRAHAAFLRGYAPEDDDGLYDDQAR
jgi:hypothetical protein